MVCLWGGASGYNCSDVQDINVCRTFTSGYACGMDRLYDSISLIGDSGGPYFNGRIAHGIQKRQFWRSQLFYTRWPSRVELRRADHCNAVKRNHEVGSRAWPGIALAVSLSVSACGTDASERTTPLSRANVSDTPTPTEKSAVPTLLTSSDAARGTDSARVIGVLRINSAGCFALDDWILVAPPGSSVVEGGQAADLAGYGRTQVGDRVKGAGGFLEPRRKDVEPERLRCVPAGGDAMFVFLGSVEDFES